MIQSTEILYFLSEELKVNTEQLNMDSDLYNDFGVDGDDFSELMDSFCKKFNVDMSNYLWYFHHNDEGSIGPKFVKSPFDRINRIAVTPRILLKSANVGKWSIRYPEHKLPKRRFDIIIVWFFWVVVILFTLVLWFKHA